jgi:Flp pilus assembly protein TadD
VPIGDEKPTDRELGLAYAQMAQHGDREGGEMALELLRKVEALEAATVKDPELHTELGFLEQRSGDIHAADREYRAAPAADPDDGTARGDMAVLFAGTGTMRRQCGCGSASSMPIRRRRLRATTWRWGSAGWGGRTMQRRR